MLFSARALQGAFAAVMAPAALSLLTVAFHEPKERARAFAVYGGSRGRVLRLDSSWAARSRSTRRGGWTLLINVPIAIIAAIAAVGVVTESKSSARHGYDVAGAITVTTGLFALVYGFTMAGTHGWSAPLTLWLLAAAGVLLATFVVIELRPSTRCCPCASCSTETEAARSSRRCWSASRCSAPSCRSPSTSRARWVSRP